MIFSSTNELTSAVRKYSINNNFSIRVITTDNNRVRATCKEKRPCLIFVS